MNYRLLTAMLLGCTSVLAGSAAVAEITGARAIPRQANLVGSGGNLVSVSWQVSTTPEHRSGISSITSQFVDPTSGMVLRATRIPLGATGAGPFVLRETISLDDATVRGWLDQGLRRVVYERTFTDLGTGSAASATMVLALSSSRLQSTRDAAPAELSIASLRLDLESGNNTAVAGVGEPLRASLILHYSGSGMLRGRWQIAEPESSEGVPLFRTIALVNVNLQANQRTTLKSPALPTARGGKYLVRFCVTSREDADIVGDAHCPDLRLAVIGLYHVQGQAGDGANPITEVSPNGEVVTEASPFTWRPLAQAVVYQLQIFELVPAFPGLDGPRDGREPKFVAGMLLDAATSSTPLSELTRSKLRADTRYLWRVTAHDETGRLVGSSAEARFVYRPGYEP